MRSSTPFGVLGIVAFTAAFACPSADAATITGTVKGPDGAPFRGAFVQARHAGLKMTVSVLTDNQGRYVAENLPEGDYRVQVRAIGFQDRCQDRREAHGRSEHVLRFRPRRHPGAVERPHDPPGPRTAARGARQEDPVRQLPELPRLPVQDGGDRAGRGRLARPRELHARGDALLAGRPAGLFRPAGRGRHLLSHHHVRREFAAAQVAGRPAGLQGDGDPVQRRGAQDRLRGFRDAGTEPVPVDRQSRQGRLFLDSRIRPSQQGRPAQAVDRRDQGISRPRIWARR